VAVGVKIFTFSTPLMQFLVFFSGGFRLQAVSAEQLIER